MIGRLRRQSSLFYVAFGAEASLIKDDLLDSISPLLDAPELIALVADALGRRASKSRKTGRYGIAPDRVLRCIVLQKLKGWSLRQLERELRCGLTYRNFTRFDHDRIPRYSTFSRTFATVGEDVVHRIHERVVERARREGIAHGRRLRTDTTVTESNVHYPTDSTLLQDGVRVLTRAVERLADECTSGAIKMVDRTRATKHRVLEIARAAKAFTDGSRTRLQEGYRGLLEIARAVVRKAKEIVRSVEAGGVKISGDVRRVVVSKARIAHFAPLVEKVIAQTKARVFGGNTRVVDKILSIFEVHTQVIRKGKAHKPTEFGRLVRIDEIENGVVSEYEVKHGNPADVEDFVPAVRRHKEIFGRAPHMATGDRGFFSAENERAARELGVKKVVLPARGRLSATRRKQQKQRWFRRALRWRGGIEARIGILKHRFGMARQHSKGARGFARDVGWSVVTQNLVTIARTRTKATRAGAGGQR